MGSAITSNTRVKVGGGYALLVSDTYLVAGCPFVLGSSPHPCVTIEWMAPAQRVRVSGDPVLLQTSIGLCKAADQFVQGVALISGVQTRVKGI
jgi:hypothetical protein